MRRISRTSICRQNQLPNRNPQTFSPTLKTSQLVQLPRATVATARASAFSTMTSLTSDSPWAAPNKSTMTADSGENENRPLPDDRDDENTFALPSGRILGFARYGARESSHPTTIYLHGYPSCRLEAGFLAPDLLSAGLQVIALDRPGFGLSTPDPSRSILDHAHDVLALADHLKLEKFAVIGISGGAPFAFACSQAIPENRLIGVGIVSGMGPWEIAMDKEVWRELWWLNKFGFIAPVYFPWLYGLIYPFLYKWIASGMNKQTYEQFLTSKQFKKLSESDKEFVLKGGKSSFDGMIRSVGETMRQDDWPKWHLQDAQLMGAKWGFELENVKREVKLWYGDKDTSTPLIFGRKIAERLPKGKLIAIEGASHASTLLQGADFVKQLVGA